MSDPVRVLVWTPSMSCPTHVLSSLSNTHRMCGGTSRTVRFVVPSASDAELESSSDLPFIQGSSPQREDAVDVFITKTDLFSQQNQVQTTVIIGAPRHKGRQEIVTSCKRTSSIWAHCRPLLRELLLLMLLTTEQTASF